MKVASSMRVTECIDGSIGSHKKQNHGYFPGNPCTQLPPYQGGSAFSHWELEIQNWFTLIFFPPCNKNSNQIHKTFQHLRMYWNMQIGNSTCLDQLATKMLLQKLPNNSSVRLVSMSNAKAVVISVNDLKPQVTIDLHGSGLKFPMIINKGISWDLSSIFLGLYFTTGTS